MLDAALHSSLLTLATTGLIALLAAGCNDSPPDSEASGQAYANQTSPGTSAAGVDENAASDRSSETVVSDQTNPSGGRDETEPAGSSGENSASDVAVSAALEPVIPEITDTCPSFVTGTVTVAGLNGISLQVGPKEAGSGALIFYWHGTGSNAEEVNRWLPLGVRREILSEGGIIVSFQGSLKTGGDCSGTGTFSKDDFKVADLIVACAVRNHGIDPHRIYTTGCSAGGLQAGCMAARRSGYVAATVPNSGGTLLPQPLQDASRVPAVMTLHGGTSDWVLVPFSQTSAWYDKQMKSAGSFVVNCNHGGGHCQAPAALYSAAWEFMKAHPFGVAPEPYSSGLPTTFPNYCSIY